ncbi:MAG: fumarylacetoacetate hydrolase family protein [Cohaesibacteraceae bacterium]
MKLISFVRLGQCRFGAAVGGGLIDLTGRLGADIKDIKTLLTADRVQDVAAYIQGRAPTLQWSDVTLLPVIPAPAKLLCIGLNYLKHKQETGRPDVDHPTVFTRYADSQVAHGQPMIKPAVSERFDYEGELAIIIGRGGRSIPEKSALQHVAGYACYNDGSVRDWQRHTAQFVPGKTFPGTGAYGPWVVTADEVEDYRSMKIATRLNGDVMQQASLGDLIFPLETIINYCSTFTPLAPGDVILTGTPGGVGDKRTPPVYMQAGDTVEVDISGVGVLRNPIVAEGSP